MKVKGAQSCPTLWDRMDCSTPGSCVLHCSRGIHGILQARILEWVAFPFWRSSQSRIEPRFPALQADSLPAEPQGKHLLHTRCNYGECEVVMNQIKTLTSRSLLFSGDKSQISKIYNM